MRVWSHASQLSSSATWTPKCRVRMCMKKWTLGKIYKLAVQKLQRTRPYCLTRSDTEMVHPDTQLRNSNFDNF